MSGGGDHGHGGINWNLVLIAIIVLAVVSGTVHIVDRVFPRSSGHADYYDGPVAHRSSSGVRNRDTVPDGWSVRR